MNSKPSSSLSFVSPTAIEHIEYLMSDKMLATNASSLCLIEYSGLVLACVGAPALHPDQMGPVAAGVYASMNTLSKATRAEHFIVTLPHNTTKLYFRMVEARLFLCAFYTDAHDEEVVLAALATLAEESRNALREEPTESRRIGSVQFIEDKLNEIFGG